MNLINLINGVNMPKIGTKYIANIKIPLIGNQYLETKVLTNKRVSILLEGQINLQGEAVVYQKNNKNYFLLNKELASYFEKNQIKFFFEEYNDILDQIKFKVNIKPLFYTGKIVLKNKKVIKK
tara:strand:- start:3008 stop:3376 length:369 start_codon:yes stop_codon:yes gene_type:complete